MAFEIEMERERESGWATYQISDVDHLNGVVNDVPSRGIWPLVELKGERE